MITFSVVVFILWLSIILGNANPLSHWDSYWRVFGMVIRNRSFPTHAKLNMLSYLIRDLLMSPVHCVLWLVDEAIFRERLDKIKLKDPVFIISQPRSGSTFLHRLLAEDDETFFAVTYLEWRWPYICVWVLLDRLGLRNWINKRSYWPNNHAGKKASLMHPHLYGDHEEHGVFLEEKFYHHYFVFRRFPFPQLLNEVGSVDTLDKADLAKILHAFERVIRKVAYYRGNNRIWLTKENESVAFYRALLEVFPYAELLFLVRDHKEMLASYVTLSRESTTAKTGINMLRNNSRWYRENILFRRKECEEFTKFYEKVKGSGKTVILNYNGLISNVGHAVLTFYHGKLGTFVPPKQVRHLIDISDEQKNRTRDYFVSKPSSVDMAGFYDFAKLVERSKLDHAD